MKEKISKKKKIEEKLKNDCINSKKKSRPKTRFDSEFDKRFMKYAGKEMTPKEFHKLMEDIINFHK